MPVLRLLFPEKRAYAVTGTGIVVLILLPLLNESAKSMVMNSGSNIVIPQSDGFPFADWFLDKPFLEPACPL